MAPNCPIPLAQHVPPHQTIARSRLRAAKIRVEGHRPPIGKRKQIRAHAVRFVRARYDLVLRSAEELGIAPPSMTIRSMKRSWTTSCWVKGRVWLNVKLVELPDDCVDYLIARALCLTTDPADQFRLLGLLQPDWERRHNVVEQFSAHNRR